MAYLSAVSYIVCMKPAADLTLPEVMPLVETLYSLPQHGVGGHLHIVLDDGNVQDDDLAYCLDRAREDGCAACYALALILLQMSGTQRRKIAEIHQGGQGDGMNPHADPYARLT